MRHRPDVLAAIAAGGVLGALARYGLARWQPVATGAFPTTTLAINLVGCFLIGVVLTALLERFPPTRYARPFLCIGFLGAFTTFSTFAVETDRLMSSGHTGTALGYVLASTLGGLVLTAVGVIMARALRPHPGRVA